MSKNISFIGAGNMAASLIGGLLAKGVAAGNICASEPGEARRSQLEQQFGIRTTADNLAACQNADIIILAVKPQIMRQVCQPLAGQLQPGQLVISIAAGISSASLQQWLQHDCLVRCMPNTPALLQQGISGLYSGPAVNPVQRQSAEQILQAAGMTVWLENEQQLDAVTAISGSGPAYFFLLAEAMTETGVKLGLDEATASLLARQTALGAARMLCESSLPAIELRRQVTSPQGTTDAAIRSLQNAGFMPMMATALQAAARRSEELAREFTKQEGSHVRIE